MTECSFKTAEELELVPQFYEGLIRTLVLLEAGEIEYQDARISVIATPEGLTGLNMGHHACGAVGCFLGWGQKLGGMRFRDVPTIRATHSFVSLVRPRDWHSNPSQYTPERCAKALRSYLTTGEPDWRV